MSKGKGQEECANIKGLIRSHKLKKGRQYNVQRKRTRRQDECENIKGLIRNHKSKKGRQYNVQMKRTRRV
jgi:hypothetical protein